MNNPLASIVLPTYNTNEKFLREAIQSILNQTEKNFELIIIDDGSSGNDYEIAKSFRDERIRVYRNNRNSGLPYTLNRGISLAKGKYICRMDSDDISLPKRLETMIQYMEKNKDIDIVGSGKINFGINNKRIIMPSTNDEIRATMFFQCPFVHPSVFFRKSSIDLYGIRYLSDEKAEDYNLWAECALNRDIKFANVKKCLLKYRLHSNQITKKSKNEMINSNKGIYKKLFSNLGISLSDKELDIYASFTAGARALTESDFNIINNIINQVIEANETNCICDDIILKRAYFNKFFKECIRQCIVYNNMNWVMYLDSDHGKYARGLYKFLFMIGTNLKIIRKACRKR